MKRMPTTAKLTASRRRLETTKLSAAAPCIGGDNNWLGSQDGGGRRVWVSLNFLERRGWRCPRFGSAKKVQGRFTHTRLPRRALADA